MAKKSSGATTTATEKVAALVAHAGEHGRCAHHCQDTARKCFPKKRSTLKMFASFPQTSGNLKKKTKKKVFAHKFSNLPQSSCVKNCFCKFSYVLQDQTTLLMILAHFQQVKKQCCPRAEDLQGSRPKLRTSPSRLGLRTLNCVLEAKDVLEDFSSVFFYIVCLFFSFCS